VAAKLEAAPAALTQQHINALRRHRVNRVGTLLRELSAGHYVTNDSIKRVARRALLCNASILAFLPSAATHQCHSAAPTPDSLTIGLHKPRAPGYPCFQPRRHAHRPAALSTPTCARCCPPPAR
jgi:hypothetical protein